MSSAAIRPDMLSLRSIKTTQREQTHSGVSLAIFELRRKPTVMQ
jgi:hypothetical protein